eukprot:evm.model.scf_436.2 EVM.evm.TU.scf_436.2   scf_436:2273-2932(-)
MLQFCFMAVLAAVLFAAGPAGTGRGALAQVTCREVDGILVDCVEVPVERPRYSCSFQPATRLAGGGAYDVAVEDSPEACCDRCFNDTRCFMWHRDNRTGDCGLWEMIGAIRGTFDDANFTTGRNPSTPEPAACTSCEVATGEVEKLGPCEVIKGVMCQQPYLSPTKGQMVDTANKCCQLCEQTSQCRSWTWRRSQKRCFMVGRSCVKRMNGDFVSGGVV